MAELEFRCSPLIDTNGRLCKELEIIRDIVTTYYEKLLTIEPICQTNLNCREEIWATLKSIVTP